MCEVDLRLDPHRLRLDKSAPAIRVWRVGLHNKFPSYFYKRGNLFNTYLGHTESPEPRTRSTQSKRKVARRPCEHRARRREHRPHALGGHMPQRGTSACGTPVVSVGCLGWRNDLEGRSSGGAYLVQAPPEAESVAVVGVVGDRAEVVVERPARDRVAEVLAGDD